MVPENYLLFHLTALLSHEKCKMCANMLGFLGMIAPIRCDRAAFKTNSALIFVPLSKNKHHMSLKIVANIAC